MKKAVIIVAGGTGTRMNSGIPKQFILLAGKPLLMHTIEAFSRACPGIHIVVALPAQHQDAWHDLCKLHHITSICKTLPGGETRFHSVKKALEYVAPDYMTAVHDGARPLVSGNLIVRAFQSAGDKGNAVPVIPVNESLRQTDAHRNWPVDRIQFLVVQTPQVFEALVLKSAYNEAIGDAFTDDATVVEKLGLKIHLIEGERTNIKITHPHDIAYAELLLRERNEGI